MIVRFLHLVDRTVGRLVEPLRELPRDRTPPFVLVDSLEIDGRQFQPWQEAIERNINAGKFDLRSLVNHPRKQAFCFAKDLQLEPLQAADGRFAGLLIRQQQELLGEIEVSAAAVAENLYKLTIKTFNRTALDNPEQMTRDDALMRSLISTHTILGIESGDFLSLTDPPEQWKHAAAACQNIGCWPILVGAGAERDTMLASPIILADYPQLAPESPGDLFDSTEIDEILTLRIMTLTDDEKRAACATDDRVRELLTRTESLAREQLAKLHGAVRGLRPINQGQPQEAAHE